MGPSILYLVVGFFVGALVASLLIFKTTNDNKKKQSAAIEERNQLIRSIAEMLADIDTLITSFRSGLLKEESFHNSLSSKLDSVNKLYKPNMHILDVYCVKYLDSQIYRYSQLAHGKISHFQFDGKHAFDNEFNPVSATQPEISSESKPESAADFFTDNPVNDTLAEPADLSIQSNDESLSEIVENKEAVASEVSEDEKSSEISTDAQIDDNEFDLSSSGEGDRQVENQVDLSSGVMESLTEESPKDVKEIEEQKPVVIDDNVLSDEKLPVVEDSTFVDEEVVSTGKLEEKADETDEDDEMIFEVKAEVAPNKNKPAITETTIDISNKAGSFDFKKTDDNSSVIPEPKPVLNPFNDVTGHQSPESEKSSFQKEFEQASKEPQDEDLMETIMDLDMGKILRSGSMSVDKNKTTLPPKYASSFTNKSGMDIPSIEKPVEQPAKISDKENLGGVLHETILIKEDKSEGEPVQPEESGKIQEKIVLARGEEGSADTILEDAPADFEINPKHVEDSKDVAITGDDVASKIDSFFGIK